MVDSECTIKVELTGFAKGLQDGLKQKRRIEDFKLSCWKGEVSCLPRCGQSTFGRKLQRCSFRLAFEPPVKCPRESPRPPNNEVTWPSSLAAHVPEGLHWSPSFLHCVYAGSSQNIPLVFIVAPSLLLNCLIQAPVDV